MVLVFIKPEITNKYQSKVIEPKVLTEAYALDWKLEITSGEIETLKSQNVTFFEVVF